MTTATIQSCDTTYPIDPITAILCALSPQFTALLTARKGRKAACNEIDVAGLACEIETGDEVSIGIDLPTKGISIGIAFDGDDLPRFGLRYDGKNGDLFDELVEKSKTAKVVSDLVEVPDELAVLRDVPVRYYDCEYPKWDGWCSISFHMDAVAIGAQPALKMAA